MTLIRLIAVGLLSVAAPLAAQDTKPVPKDSARVSLSGCSKGYIFTVGPRTIEAPGSFDAPEGTHIRMNGPKKVINEIKAHEGSAIEVSGLMKKGQYLPGGVSVGGGVRVGAPAGGVSSSPTAGQAMIDVEGWRLVPAGSCAAR